MPRASACKRAAGTSLVEALVAMAIMAFGMLAVVGVQATLRLNADVAKQRSEAVRIAQEAMEAARGFSVIDTTSGRAAYGDIADVSNQAVTSDTANTTFLLSRTVTSRAAPDRKEVAVLVRWTDRIGTQQQVELLSMIGANDPVASLALSARPNGIPARQPLGRNPAIPARAVPVGEGLSGFKPPGAAGDSGVVWVFNDLTGVIVGVCNGVATAQASLTAADVSSCNNNAFAQPLSGFVRFATDMIDTSTGLPRRPNAADAENPLSTARNLEIEVTLSSTGHPIPDHACFVDAPTSATTTATVVPYYCAIFSNPVRAWSGISTVVPLAFTDSGTPWEIAVDAVDATATRFRVCRYTPATSDAQAVPNRQHPRQYTNVTVQEPLSDQNFLIIRAGDSTMPFTCPADIAADPTIGDIVNSNTLAHQPAP